MNIGLDRIAGAAAIAAVRVFAPDLARLGDRCEALRQEGEDLRAALAGELPGDHPVSWYVAAWRSVRPDIASEWVAHSDDRAERREGDAE